MKQNHNRTQTRCLGLAFALGCMLGTQGCDDQEAASEGANISDIAVEPQASDSSPTAQPKQALAQQARPGCVWRRDTSLGVSTDVRCPAGTHVINGGCRVRGTYMISSGPFHGTEDTPVPKDAVWNTLGANANTGWMCTRSTAKLGVTTAFALCCEG